MRMTLRPRLEIVNGKRQGFAKPQKTQKPRKAGHDRRDRHDYGANNGRDDHKAGRPGRGRGAGRGRGMAASETEAWKSGRLSFMSAGCQVLHTTGIFPVVRLL